MRDRLKGGLIVSCQAGHDEPLHGSAIMAAMARAAAQSGAVAIRAEGPSDIRAIRAAVDLPIVGLYKIRKPEWEIYITPTLESAREVAEAGADFIAIDATTERRPDGLTLEETIRRIKEELGRPVFADVSTLEEGLRAEALGASLVGTTLSGYTPQSPKQEGPDWRLLEDLTRRLTIPVIMEGRIWEPAEARQALERGAWAVVVGSAITRPQLITERFLKEMRRHGHEPR
ncbi:N-acetylmannosamine-6-phosphate 2-epimerase [bacterium]|nr:N-acetylmannosamine-6-phosphate 2-epimerase [bacterium]